eukprot:NODE_2715_length_1006_cov_69.830489_g2695_i0.p1 GENE.NODE_2715_length_1006_cov_69.830489_g2695_i0~~NODE_2715_length_1006_cov_69.830489_g2695_i0.p1  ORF type:complete len:286 (+),score=77.12 NODE_2715_length_1006_cov_69.830489_g2695_i0:69-926(+)
MPATLYADLYKDVKDAFTKNFQDGRKVEIKTKAAGGEAITFDYQYEGAKSKASMSFETPIKFMGKSYKDKMTLDSGSLITYKGTADGQFVAGLKTDATVKFSIDDGLKGLEVANELKPADKNFAGTLKYLHGKAVEASVALRAVDGRLNLGVFGTFCLQKSQLKSYAAAANFKTSDILMALALDMGSNKVQLGLTKPCKCGAKMALEASATTAGADPVLSAASEKVVGKTLVKGVITSKCDIKAAAKFAAASGLTGYVSTSFNPCSGAASSGFKFEFDEAATSKA